MTNPLDLWGSTIMVTGASAGIGQATAQLLSEFGAKIVLVSRNAENLEKTKLTLKGNGHLVAPFDFDKIGEIEAWYKTTVSNSGPLSGLVHCAGSRLLRPLKLSDPVETEGLLRQNVTSGLVLAKAFRQKGLHSAPASIVYVSSVMGYVGAPGITAYCTSKAAVIGMVKSVALELARDQIRVNCVAPGFVNTDMLKKTEESVGPEMFANIRNMHPLGFGEPLDVANAIAFLLARTSRWITGTTLVVDGGYTAH